MSRPLISRSELLALLGPPMGHVWTIGHHLGRQQRTQPSGVPRPFSVEFADAVTGEIVLNGTLHNEPAHTTARDLVVLIHGLGGSADSGYMVEATAAALDLGFSVLRMSLRGADRGGHDFYHAGLFADVLRVLEHETVRAYDNVYVLGVSLGGHVVLRTATCNVPSNVRAVAALCPPLDLGACSAAFDRKRQWLFRHHVLDGLKLMYARFAERHVQACLKLGLPSAKQVYAIRSIGEWDRRIVAPRHGFPSAASYYTSQSAGSKLSLVHLPALILTTRWDPMVPHSTTVHVLKSNHGSGSTPLEARSSTDDTREIMGDWVFRQVTPHVQHIELEKGGHVAFPVSGKVSVFSRTLRWLRLHSA